MINTGARGRVRFGVVGCADFATRRMLPALVSHEAVDVVAIASRAAETARSVAARFGCEPVVGYDNLLARSDIDAVYLPLPTGLHVEWTLAAVEAGKHVLVEKPACLSREDGERIVAAADRNDVLVAENFLYPHHSQHLAIRRMVDDGMVGEVRAFTSSFGIPRVPPDSFRMKRELAGGALYDVGVYPLSAARYYLHFDLSVIGACLGMDPVSGVDITGSVLLCGSAGQNINVEFGFAHSYQSTISIWGSTGKLSLARAFTPPEGYHPVVRLEQQDKVTELTLPADSQVHNAVSAFVAACDDVGLRRGATESLVEHAGLLAEVCAAAKRCVLRGGGARASW